MSERRWTDEQLSAINTRDKTLLVSAAAGSGKTATLTERIIRSLLDESAPIDIDSILVVTFTNAAAAELRQKISAALTEAVEKNPDNKHLRRQLYLLPSAKIRTIDSFCNEILRANADRVGLPPNYRIADTAESELLAISIIEGLIEAVYNGEIPEIATPQEFEELADCLTDSKRTEDLSEVLRYVHLKCDSAELGIDLLSELIKKYDSSFDRVENTFYGDYLMKAYAETVEHYISAYMRYISAFSADDVGESKYLSVAESDISLLRSMKSASEYEAARELILNFELVRKPAVRGEKSAAMEDFSILRDMMKEELTELRSYFSYTTEMWRGLFASLSRLLSLLYRFESEFDARFLEEKRRIGALSYADIERYTYKCLLKDGEPTDIAINTANQFEAIYIDEYQDVNSLQNRIFEAIAKPNNRFMVGDIKQSIYGFRSACPEIFASMKNAFPRLEDAVGESASIFMSRNFRCDRGIVDFVNNIFDSAFGFVSESIGYEEGDRLVCSKLFADGEPEYSYPQVCMVDKPTEDDDTDAAEAVAAKIKEILATATLDDGRAPRPSDIAIILRNARGKDIKYADALERAGIPSCISGAKDFFLSSEVLLALCLLNTIDNPKRDIYLGGLLCSPLFDFTADELVMIRSAEGETLYERLVNYVECNEEFTKGRDFLNTLEYYRAISEGVGVDTLIYKLYRQTGLLSLSSRSGGKENLTLLYDYARSYEAGAFKGLYSFIHFINSIIDKKTTFDDSRARSGVDAVKIVTSHASKGLEYPIVFLVEADGKIYNKERASRLVFSEDFGISFRLRTPSGLAVVNNPIHDIINHRIDKKLYEEELRVLYVALTRARERLFVVGKCPTVKRDEYEKKISVIRDNLTEHSFRDLDSYLEIIMACEGGRVLDSGEFLGTGMSPECCDNTDVNENSDTSCESQPSPQISADELYARFNYEYPKKYMTALPEKMSVSVLSPTVLDGSEAECASFSDADAEEDEKQILPSFISGGVVDESAKRGIATHLLLQFCDFDKLKENGAVCEMERLCSQGFFSREDADRVRIKEIELFRRSELFSEILSAKKIYRELRFNVRLPATLFTSDEERADALVGEELLVQGVIDCIILRADGRLAVCDYKTDRLTKEQLENPTLAEETLRAKHRNQLRIYAAAAEKIFSMPVDILQVYSLPLGRTVDIW